MENRTLTGTARACGCAPKEILPLRMCFPQGRDMVQDPLSGRPSCLSGQPQTDGWSHSARTVMSLGGWSTGLRLKTPFSQPAAGLGLPYFPPLSRTQSTPGCNKLALRVLTSENRAGAGLSTLFLHDPG